MKDLTTETCVACAAGCHEDDTCLELFRCACPCHGPQTCHADAAFVIALAGATRRRQHEIRVNAALTLIEDLEAVARSYRYAARSRYQEAETLFRIALETDLLIESTLTERAA